MTLTDLLYGYQQAVKRYGKRTVYRAFWAPELDPDSHLAPAHVYACWPKALCGGLGDFDQVALHVRRKLKAEMDEAGYEPEVW